ncbi:MAG TPA: type II secretion system protein [Fibrobacteraceae bacterium]|nr:type II secretion system protein [Fibrobacteraceae bacterium]
MKKGFTLIELMVVIVIIGILAAIAVPKMFGMSAKAKASEVGPAAGNWAKVIAAYTAEKDTIGTFKEIGYIPPGTVSSSGDSSETSVFIYADASTDGVAKWSASNKVKLNDCIIHKAAVWTVTFTFATMADTASVANDSCEILTPNFSKIQ